MRCGRPWLGEHRARYRFVAELATSKCILDVGCGDGYGSLMMAAAGAEFVIGLDSSPGALAVSSYSRRVAYCRADATQLPLPASSMDLVTCFETIEHVAKPELLLREAARVLRSDGSVVVSTPNALRTQPRHGVPRNPYHVREFVPEEFVELLESVFDGVQVLGQRVDPQFGRSAFFDLPARPARLWDRVRLTGAKLRARLPMSAARLVSVTSQGRLRFPDESEFLFDEVAISDAHVLVGICCMD